MGVSVLAQGPCWAIVDKPSGLAVHRSALVRDRKTLVREARKALGHLISPVHRLDRATSGCLLLSTDPSETAGLQAALAEGEKRYIAFVRGRIATVEPVHFDRPLKDDNGYEKEAVTVFCPIAGSTDPRCSLVLAIPLTGRMHQIRRHLRDLSHPILGDSSHGDTRVNKHFRDTHGLDRLALHCVSLRLSDEITAVAPLPPALRALGEQMPWWETALTMLPELRQATSV